MFLFTGGLSITFCLVFQSSWRYSARFLWYEPTVFDNLCQKLSEPKKGVLRNFVKFTGKHLCKRLFFNKVSGKDLQLY